MKISPQPQIHLPESLTLPIPENEGAAMVASGATNATKERALYAVGRGRRDAVLGNWEAGSRRAGSATIRDLVQNMLTSPAPGEAPQFDEGAWSAVRDLDSRRQGNENCATILGSETMRRLRDIAAAPTHPRHADAQLLTDIMTRPLGENPPSLESHVSALVSRQVQATISQDFDTKPDCDFTSREGVITFVRTLNGIMQGVALNSQDYTATGRALILKGATHLSGLIDAPAGKPGSATETAENDALAARLQRAIFCFPTVPAEGDSKLGLHDFNPEFNFDTMQMDPNPLEKRFGMQFYWDADAYQVMDHAPAGVPRAHGAA